MMFRKIRVVASVLATVMTIGGPLYAQPASKESSCEAKNGIVIEAENDDDRRQACRGALDARRFLIRQGLTLPQSIRIEVVSAMPDGIADTAVGAFSRESEKIFVLSYRSFEARGRRPLGMAEGKPAYRAVVAHEVAHAIAFHNFKTNPTLAAQEYIGFVTLISTVPQSVRHQILQRYVDYDPQWVSYPEILYLNDPGEFGVHAYRHFLLPDNGPRFLRKVLDGGALGASD